MKPRLSKLLRCQAGTSTTEYALIIALIAAAMMLGGDSLRFTADSTFARASLALGASPQTATADGTSSQAATQPTSIPQSAVSSAMALHILAWGVLFAAAAVIVHSRFRQMRARKAIKEIACTEEPAAEEPANPNFKKRQEIQRILLRNFDDALHSRIEVRHIMSRTVRAVEPHTSLDDLRTLMECEGFHHLLVMKNGALAGVISDRDIKNKKGRQAAHIMTARPMTISPTTHISQAITSMLHRRISCLPVVDDGKVKGILTTTDLLMSLQCLMQLLDRAHANQDPSEAALPTANHSDPGPLTSVAT